MQVSKSGRLIYFYLLRTGIILACVMLISIFLYAPYVSRFYSTEAYINVYTWADMFELSDIYKFEGESGIKVNLIYYDNCEELLTKLEITKGRSCDLLLLADCSMQELVQMDLLAPIDKNKLDFWQALEPKLLNQAYDVGNKYSLPYSWDIYGIGVNLAKFGNQLPVSSWGLVFDQNLGATKIGMMEDALSAVSIAAQYLYHDCKCLNLEQLSQIKKLLLQQKQQVEAYTALRGDYLLSSGTSPVITTQAACIYRAMQNNAQIKFLIPQEGGFISVENFAIFKQSAKHDLVYKFINFMYQKKIMYNYVNKTHFLPTRSDLLREIDLGYIGNREMILDRLCFAKIAFFTYMVSREEIMRLWMEVKAT